MADRLGPWMGVRMTEVSLIRKAIIERFHCTYFSLVVGIISVIYMIHAEVQLCGSGLQVASLSEVEATWITYMIASCRYIQKLINSKLLSKDSFMYIMCTLFPIPLLIYS